MEVVAIAKNVRISPEKMRLVAVQVKNMTPQQAIKILDFVPKKSSLSLKKVIASAIANAKNNFDLSEDSLAFREISVTKGMVFKRFRAVARGRVHPILKRTSHIKVVLEGEEKKEVSKVPQVSEVAKVSKVSQKSEVPEEAKESKAKNDKK